jgi:hypothetical protein
MRYRRSFGQNCAKSGNRGAIADFRVFEATQAKEHAAPHDHPRQQLGLSSALQLSAP